MYGSCAISLGGCAPYARILIGSAQSVISVARLKDSLARSRHRRLALCVILTSRIYDEQRDSRWAVAGENRGRKCTGEINHAIAP